MDRGCSLAEYMYHVINLNEAWKTQFITLKFFIIHIPFLKRCLQKTAAKVRESNQDITEIR